MKKRFLIFIVTIVGVASYAQQDAQFTNYMYNTININPAYAGSRDFLSVFGLHRNQWVGLDGAPVTNVISLDTPLNNSNFGLGFSIINDRIGPSDDNSFSADVSYSVKTSEKYQLSFGIKAKARLLDVDFNKLNIYNQGDALAQYNVENKFLPNVGVGIYFHSNKSYFGLSIPSFFETKHFKNGETAFSSEFIASQRMNYFLMAGHVLDLSKNVKFKPAALIKMITNMPLQVDLSGNLLFNERFTAGLSYRWSAALSAMLGFKVNDKVTIGYGYDREPSRLTNFNSGSHEVFLQFNFANIKNKEQIETPRFF